MLFFFKGYSWLFFLLSSPALKHKWLFFFSVNGSLAIEMGWCPPFSPRNMDSLVSFSSLSSRTTFFSPFPLSISAIPVEENFFFPLSNKIRVMWNFLSNHYTWHFFLLPFLLFFSFLFLLITYVYHLLSICYMTFSLFFFFEGCINNIRLLCHLEEMHFPSIAFSYVNVFFLYSSREGSLPNNESKIFSARASSSYSFSLL